MGCRSIVSVLTEAPSSAATRVHTGRIQNARGSLTRICGSSSCSLSHDRSSASTDGWLPASAAIAPAVGRVSMVRTGTGLSTRLWNSVTHSGS